MLFRGTFYVSGNSQSDALGNDVAPSRDAAPGRVLATTAWAEEAADY